jgi:uncharacterized protein YPO0396
MMILNLRKSRKYRYMDANLTQRRKGLEDKIPDIRKTLHMVEFLQERRVSLLLRTRASTLSDDHVGGQEQKRRSGG